MANDKRIALGLFLLAAVTFGWFFGGAGWNQDAQFDLTRALVERHTLYIDGYDANTGDVSRGVGGHTYINKTPGVSFMAAIPYSIVLAVETGLRAPVDRMTRTNAWIVTAFSCGLCGALISPVLFLYGRRRIGASPRTTLCVCVAIAFGTMVFPYSTMLFAHVPAALFLLLAVTLAREHPVAAGAAAGIATCCFYVCAIAPAILFVLALLRSRRDAAHFVAGGLPFAILLGIYQWLCFGSPLRTAVESSTQFTEKRLLFGVFHRPSLEALYGIAFSPYRGLFFASPVLLSALIGLVVMLRRRDLRHEFVAVTAIGALFFFIIGGFNGWNGGCAFGPRYLLPIVPLLGIPMLAASRIASKALRSMWIAAAFLSIGIAFVATATDPLPCPSVHDPIRRFLLPAFFTGRIPEETQLAFHLTERVNNVALPSAAGNLGETLCGKGTRSSIVPILVWLVAGTALLFWVAGTASSGPAPERRPSTR
jgi:NADH:ubiquinone oxidoreductase subunit 6 (subunit J)